MCFIYNKSRSTIIQQVNMKILIVETTSWAKNSAGVVVCGTHKWNLWATLIIAVLESQVELVQKSHDH